MIIAYFISLSIGFIIFTIGFIFLTIIAFKDFNTYGALWIYGGGIAFIGILMCIFGILYKIIF